MFNQLKTKMKKGEWYFGLEFDNIPIFQGQIFYSINDKFPSETFDGKTLLSVFEQFPRKIINYLRSDYFFITNSALEELLKEYSEKKKNYINSLINIRDSKFFFKNSQIYSADLPINGMAGFRKFDGEVISQMESEVSFYYGNTLKEIFENNPSYIINLITTHNINIPLEICDEFKTFTGYTRLEDAVKEEEEMKKELERERQMEEISYWEAYDAHYNSTKGYQDAFEGDSDAEWNID